ncbi:hypothetical protein RU50_004693 [Salmonella enterica subsp. enterica]|nr:hypothetical protein [Salmonella enterica subsp. enterica]
MSGINQPAIFRNDDLNVELHATMYEGQPVFFAVEVATALRYTNPHKALQDHCKSLIKLNSNESLESGFGFRPRGILLLVEADLYRLILRSKIPSAEKFQDWICEDVLPSIRKTGGYQLPQFPVPQTKVEALALALELAKENEKLAEERDEAIRTKAQISQTREATACQRNAVYQRLANNAIKEREEMAALLGASKEWASTRAVWRATGMWYGYRRLMNWCDDHNMPDTYCFDPKSDDRMLCYPRQAWVEVYGVDIAKLF